MKFLLFTLFSLLFTTLSFARKYDIAISHCVPMNGDEDLCPYSFYNYIYPEKDLIVSIGDTVVFRAFNDDYQSSIMNYVEVKINSSVVAVEGIGSLQQITVYEIVVTSSFVYHIKIEELDNINRRVTSFGGNVIVLPNSGNLDISHLRAYYKFDNDVLDASTNNLDGVNLGASFTNDRFGNVQSAALFQGSSYVDLENASYIDSCFSLSFWFKLNGVNNTVQMMRFGANDGYGEMRIGFSDNNVLRLVIGRKVDYNAAVDDELYYDLNSDPLALNTWYHFAITGQKSSVTTNMFYGWGGHYFSCYLNGSMIKQNYPSHGHFDEDLDRTIMNCISAGFFQTDSYPTIGGNNFNGAIDDFTVWNKELTKSEIQMLHSNQNVGINELTNDILKIYPNPVYDVLMLENSTGEIEISDLLGRSILKTSSTTINVGELKAGKYLIRSEGLSSSFVKY